MPPFTRTHGRLLLILGWPLVLATSCEGGANGARQNRGLGGAAGQNHAAGGTAGDGTSGESGAAPSHHGGAPEIGSGGVGSGGEPTARAGAGEAGSTRGGAGGDPGSAGSGHAVAPCAEYCALVRTHCSGPRLQYQNLDQCLLACEHFPAGSAEVQTGNSIACRLARAELLPGAESNALDAYCQEAGPDGGDRCGTPCDAYCAVTTATCTEQSSPTHFFESIDECRSVCATLPSIPYVYGDSAVIRGNTVQCRLYHAIRASERDTAQHCVHALGASTCK